jgi:PAS domain S-box-containing protein
MTQKREKPAAQDQGGRQLRADAEAQLARSPDAAPAMTAQTHEEIVHELQVHQIELEMQNDDLRRAQLALEESRDKYLDLYDFSPLGYVSFTRGGRIAEVNLTGAALLGVERQQLINQGFGSFVAPEDLDRWEQHLVAVWQSEEQRSCELALTRKDGATFQARLDSIRLGQSAAQAEGSGASAVIRTALSDITERKRAEKALQYVHKELEQRVEQRTAELRQTVELLRSEITERKQAEEALQASQEQVRQMQKMEAVGRLAGGIAHDFNNLLTAILSQSELILMTLADRDPALRSDVEEINKMVLRGVALTRQLLTISRRQPLHIQVLNLNRLVTDMAPMLQRVVGEHVEFDLRQDPTMSYITADPGQLEQVLLNLAINARDAMPQGGRLTIATTDVALDESSVQNHPGLYPGRYARLTVSDTGIGMDEETQRHLFEPFFTTKEKGKGTGLGLAMVYGIVTQSGGYISCSSESAQGTTFEIYFPGTEARAVAPPEPKAAPSAPSTGTETILLVEDDDQVRTAMLKILRIAGYIALEAATPTAALSLAESHPEPIHLLLTDVVMPHMNGEELAQRVKALRPDTKVIHMSGYTDDAVLRNGRLPHGDAFLAKPFTFSTLMETVRAILDGTPSPRPPAHPT